MIIFGSQNRWKIMRLIARQNSFGLDIAFGVRETMIKRSFMAFFCCLSLFKSYAFHFYDFHHQKWSYFLCDKQISITTAYVQCISSSFKIPFELHKSVLSRCFFRFFFSKSVGTIKGAHISLSTHDFLWIWKCVRAQYGSLELEIQD